MQKRRFLTHLGLAGMLPAGTALAHAPAQAQPALLTVAGAIRHPNRGALQPTEDLLAAKQGVQFSQARSFDAMALQQLPAVSIAPTLEYDARRHTLEGPLLATVIAAAGVPEDSTATLVLRAVDGYKASLSVADAVRLRMVVALRMDGAPLPLGGLGPQWAVYDADALPQFKDKPLKERFALAPWGLYLVEVR
ncbi:molybdopterin-dependent oxidoreductase [Paracidovorax citrulli]|uniref:molybdopterin-dependent oxidoreductase n=1 Tax=Paracidovorax citrulli TaxID=80869 RepID=UPI0005FB5640|nr:molybdopterin-dependent oxidoreductase [Paracidovorax citrulli]